MKILITGSQGQLGRELADALTRAGRTDFVCAGIDTLDITDQKAVEAFLRAGAFTHVVNCAAFTAVDRAEELKAECAAINIAGVENSARLADELDLRIVHISTDYIFDGTACR
ncbi:MAG: sugar nucleotide-binding protein, partial [Muribaculaceae bacterium]|nr:sugar nucleotide-binding protein [Muribaculaceae bacterium]